MPAPAPNRFRKKVTKKNWGKINEKKVFCIKCQSVIAEKIDNKYHGLWDGVIRTV